MNLVRLHQIDMQGNHYNDWMEYHAQWIIIWKNKYSDVLTGQWVEGIVTHTPEYMEWYRKNTYRNMRIETRRFGRHVL